MAIGLVAIVMGGTCLALVVIMQRMIRLIHRQRDQLREYHCYSERVRGLLKLSFVACRNACEAIDDDTVDGEDDLRESLEACGIREVMMTPMPLHPLTKEAIERQGKESWLT